MTREIGSNFYSVERKDYQYFLFGRASLDYIIRDILVETNVKRAILPAYCCDSMIVPFLRNEIDIRFYDVLAVDGGIKAVLPEPSEDEMILYMDYFGYKTVGLENVVKWPIAIEDCTHKLMAHSSEADYSFASLRKWSGFSGFSWAYKKAGRFTASRHHIPNIEYEELFESASRDKDMYLFENKGSKESFLEDYAEAEEIAECNYLDHGPCYQTLINALSFDKDSIAAKRRANAAVLFEELKDVKGLKFIYGDVSESEAPLHVPVLVDNGIRDELRKHLITNEIYCPIHWPLTKLHTISKEATEIYESELSLVCDQRYNEEDMRREASVIKQFFGE